MIGIDTVTAIVTAIMVGLVIGVFRAFDYLRNKWSKETSHGSAELGRPVAVSECKSTHDALAVNLQRGSDKFDKQAESIQEIKETVIELRGDVKSGFSTLKLYVEESVKNGVKEHTRQYHKRDRPSATRETGDLSSAVRRRRIDDD